MGQSAVDVAEELLSGKILFVRARGILSYFLRDRLYPGIMHPGLSEGQVSRRCGKTKRQRAGQSADNVAGEVLSGKRFCLPGRGAFKLFPYAPRHK